jgi:hypothetical protein
MGDRDAEDRRYRKHPLVVGDHHAQVQAQGHRRRETAEHTYRPIRTALHKLVKAHKQEAAGGADAAVEVVPADGKADIDWENWEARGVSCSSWWQMPSWR